MTLHARVYPLNAKAGRREGQATAKSPDRSIRLIFVLNLGGALPTPPGRHLDI